MNVDESASEKITFCDLKQAEAETCLDIKHFLKRHVFIYQSVQLRSRVLYTVTAVAVSLFAPI